MGPNALMVSLNAGNMAEKIKKAPEEKPIDTEDNSFDLVPSVLAEANGKEKPKRKKRESGNAEPEAATTEPPPEKKFWTEARIVRVLGLACLLIALFLLVSFLSYLTTWQQDQDKVWQFSWGLLLQQKVEIANKLGRLGAVVSDFFIYNGFGIAALMFVPLFAFLGVNLAGQKNYFNLNKMALHGVFAMLFVSFSLGFILSGTAFPFGGAFGQMLNDYCGNFIGSIGTGVLLSFILLVYLTLAFNLKFSLPKLKTQEADLPVAEIIPEIISEVVIPASADEKIPSETAAEKDEKKSTIILPPVISKPIPEDATLKPFVKETPPVEILVSENKIPESDMTLIVEKPKEEVILSEDEIPEGALDTLYDPTLDLRDYKFPTLDLLEQRGQDKIVIDQNELENNKNQIIQTLSYYGIDIQKIKATVGPTVTLYEIVPAPGVRISKIKNLEDDIALSLAALGIRIIAPIPGKGTIGIEVPNRNKEVVNMRTLLSSEKFQNAPMDLPIALGKTISNEIFIADLSKMPHLLVAGATGQGKSVGINAILVSLLYKKHPSQLKLVMVDPKKVELSLYQRIEKHFLAKLPGEADPIIVDTKKVIHTLKALCIEMDIRYDLLKEAGVRNLKEYNEKFVARKLNPQAGHRFLPYIVLVIDEFGDLIMTAGKEIETPIARLAQLARAIGIHLILATQRPSVNIITGVIKANFPARIAFKVSAKVDSRTILDAGGADQLIGQGDMLVSIGGETTRLQCGFVDTHEVEEVVDFVAAQRGYPEAYQLPEYKEEDEQADRGDFDPNERDDLFEDAARIIVQHQQGSTSLLQRRLKLGYNRAGRLMDQMESAGIVGPNVGSKAREVNYKTEMDLEQYLTNMGK